MLIFNLYINKIIYSSMDNLIYLKALLIGYTLEYLTLSEISLLRANIKNKKMFKISNIENFKETNYYFCKDPTKLQFKDNLASNAEKTCDLDNRIVSYKHSNCDDQFVAYSSNSNSIEIMNITQN